MQFDPNSEFGRGFEEKMISRQGDAYFNRGDYEQAKSFYWIAIKAILGQDFRVPSLLGPDGSVKCKEYIDMSPVIIAMLSGCYVGLIKCCIQEKDIESAFMWMEELEVVYQNVRFTSPNHLYEWTNFNLDLPEMTLQRVIAMTTIADQFYGLGNTATAFFWRWRALTLFTGLSSHHHTPFVNKLNDMDVVRNFFRLRHPDPILMKKFGITDPKLQVRGSWKRLSFKSPPGRVLPRSGHCSFIWKSRLYVAGGQADSLGPFHRDLWCMDLTNPTHWRRLPDYPVPQSQTSIAVNWSFLVNDLDNRAYFVNGRPQVDYFDLVSEQWGSIMTTYKPTQADKDAGVTGDWPYRGKITTQATMQLVNGKLYAFGGDHRDTNLGSNLFMELNISTRIWRRLTGYVMPPLQADLSCPDARKEAGSWVGKDKNRMYIFYGHIDRQGANLRGEPHGAEAAHIYRDMWSWNIKEEKWRRERISGNYPCSRTEFGYTYNPKLDKLFLFGGYSSAFTTLFPEAGISFEFAYFADTFMLDCEDSPSVPLSNSSTLPLTASNVTQPKWKQVITQGFPTYRCEARLMTDEDTGKMYLFGGFTNSDWLASRNDLLSRAFGDLWELRVDIRDGGFEVVDWEEEAKTAKVGPWHRCFTCGSVGSGKKCGGTCGGRAFFCNTECLKEGWKDHKGMHQCRKA